MKAGMLVAGFFILGAAAIVGQSASSSRGSIQGVWRIAAFTHDSEPTHSRPQPSLCGAARFCGSSYA